MTGTIGVRVRLFAGYRESAGTGQMQEVLPAGARVSDLIAQLRTRVPGLGDSPALIAVNQEYVGPDLILHEDDEVAFIPPVSGGSEGACFRL